ncbi:MAG: peptide chain release factor 2 [Planctomycetota bacterium]
MSEELAEQIKGLEEQVATLARGLSVDQKLAEQAELEEKMVQPTFWDRSDLAQKVVKQVSRLKVATQPFVEARQRLEDAQIMLELAEEADDASTRDEVGTEIQSLTETVGELELQALLSGKHDDKSCFFAINAGAGGTEACDWAAMLFRMYTRFFELKGWKFELIDDLAGEEAGLKHATIKVDGPYTYGRLRSELGVHRLVRISPYDAQSRRHTSFASIDVTPELDDDIEIEIKDAELRVDTYRAGGAGGQHVNKTDSAVRLTHLPTGIVVQCQNERSQHQNRRVAMNMLTAKLVQFEEAKRDEELKGLYGTKGEIAWGHQIRSYVLQPYTMVKDHRTDVQTGNAQGVLDGNIEPFIEGYLKWKLQQKAAKANKG